MIRKATAVIAFASLLFGVAGWAQATDPVVAVVGFFLTKAGDDLYDRATGKPDLKAMDRRLKELEQNAVLKSEMREEIRKLRESINDRVTKEEFSKMVERTMKELDTIKRRLDSLEERVEMLDVVQDDMKKGTNNAKASDFFIRRGAEFLGTGDTNRAIANLNIAIRLDSKKAESYKVRAMVYDRLKAPQVVIIDATEAIRLDPKLKGVHELRGRANFSQRHNWDAHDDFSHELANYPKTPDNKVHCARLLMLLGSVSYACGDYESAITDCSEAIKLNPTNAPECAIAAAYRYRGLGKYYLDKRGAVNDNVIADLTEAIRLEPTADAHLVRGLQLYLRSSASPPDKKDLAEKDREQAIADFNAVIRLDPDNVTAYYHRAHLYKRNRDFDRGIADYTELIKRFPTYKGFYESRGWLYYQKGDSVRGKADYAEAAKQPFDLSKVWMLGFPVPSSTK